ncbi:YisL family protein [Paenalkalicoccus suaedae]|uniref:YisL family protein n=1 Tax=Paenalkalicoccus suaedae TaxID=2592382 RepID=A0A859FHX7_9BACI|nr:YisL family protein [Paenalkalicoccus suaedae]QKS71825.1 YisL family protein [Paenalkalicoccus suaedae]
MNYAIFLHSHSLFWLLAVISFFVAMTLYNRGKQKPGKIVHMILRLLYLLLLGTGITMIIMNTWWGSIVKGILAFWLIFTMELLASRTAKGTLTPKTKQLFWIQFIIAVVVVIYFGYFVN